MASKVVKVNLEEGMPTVEAALSRMRNELRTAKGLGAKAVILVHGYGSSGTVGRIRPAAQRALADPSMRGLVKAFCPGEKWHLERKRFLSICGTLSESEREIDGNFGVTVVILT
jgi:hypothetical protein